MIVYEIISFLLVGFITGILSGLLGIGGGAVFVPALLFLLPLFNGDGSYAHMAVATSLFAGMFTATASFAGHYRKNNVDIKNAVMLGIGSVISAFVFSMVAANVSSEFIKITLAVVLSLVAANLFFNKSGGGVNFLNLPSPWLVLFGVAAGAISAFTGLGGGVIFVPVLVYLFGMEMRKGIGTSAPAVALTMFSAALSFMLTGEGYINYTAGLTLAAGSIAGSFAGVKFIFKLKVPVIKRIFSILLLIIIIKLFL